MGEIKELEKEYFEWLNRMMPGWRNTHSLLIRQLFDIPFTYSMEMDANRLNDGLGLRTRFCWERGYGYNEREALKEWCPCSVLEVMIALAFRCEEEFMTLYTEEEMVERWIGPMIRSMELDTYDDGHFDPEAVQIAVGDIVARRYSPDGRGGLFYIPGFRGDMRQIEIWEQMMAWIEYYLNHGGTKDERI